jgi:hypothetical protein
VSVAPEAAQAFDSYLAKWDEAEPEQPLLRIFVHAARDPRIVALGCLEHELGEAAFAIREPAVAQAKLGWWLEEIGQARSGQPRHPILRRLHEAGGSALLHGGHAESAITGAAAVAGIESIGELVSLLGALRQMGQPFAILRARALGRELPSPAAAQALAASRLLLELQRYTRFAAPERGRIPLELLARHGTTRAGLVGAAQAPTAARVLRSLAEALLGSLDGVDAYAIGAVDGARILVGRARCRQLLRAPLAVVRERAALHTWRLLWPLWRYARHGQGRSPAT